MRMIKLKFKHLVTFILALTICIQPPVSSKGQNLGFSHVRLQKILRLISESKDTSFPEVKTNVESKPSKDGQRETKLVFSDGSTLSLSRPRFRSKYERLELRGSGKLFDALFFLVLGIVQPDPRALIIMEALTDYESGPDPVPKPGTFNYRGIHYEVTQEGALLVLCVTPTTSSDSPFEE